MKKSTKILNCYLIIWLLCSFIYYYSANITNGDCFQFQEDILLKIKSEEFQKKADIRINNKYIKNLLLNYDEDNVVYTMGDSRDNLYIYDFNGLSKEWTEYYEIKLLAENLNYFTYESLGIEKRLGDTDFNKVKLTCYYMQNEYESKITSNELKYYDSRYDKYMNAKLTTYIWIEKEKFKYADKYIKILGMRSKYYPTEIIRNLLNASVNYIDNDYKIVEEIQQHSFKYPIVDFMYFSAITITTLGYGDILPNSSFIRVIVMIETLIGVILIGLFVSQKFREIDNIKHEKCIIKNIFKKIYFNFKEKLVNISKKKKSLGVYNRVIQIIKANGYDDQKNICDYWFENKDKLKNIIYKYEPEFRYSNGYIQEFEMKLRWKSNIGEKFQKRIREHIINVQKEHRKKDNYKRAFEAKSKEEFLKRTLVHIELKDISIVEGKREYRIEEFYKYFNTDSNMYGLLDLSGIELNNIDLNNCIFKNINFTYSNFENSRIQQCYFEDVNFCSSNFKNSHISLVHMINRCNVSNCNFKDSYVDIFLDTAVSNIKYNKIRYIDLIKETLKSFSTNSRKRHASGKRKYSEIHLDNIEKISEDKELIQYLKWQHYIRSEIGKLPSENIIKKLSFLFQVVLTKYWQSYFVLAFWALSINMIFAGIYYINGASFTNIIGKKFFTAFYYSIVTFTTLGYGDISPTTDGMRLTVVTEVILGYVILGIFVFLIGDKINKKY